jgi:hypothetical protein
MTENGSSTPPRVATSPPTPSWHFSTACSYADRVGLGGVVTSGSQS